MTGSAISGAPGAGWNKTHTHTATMTDKHTDRPMNRHTHHNTLQRSNNNKNNKNKNENNENNEKNENNENNNNNNKNK